MPRPRLEIWRDLNRDRDRDPSSLLRLGIGRKPMSIVERAAANLEREMASPQYQARMRQKRAIEPRPLSHAERALRDMSSPEWQEKWRKRQEFLKACGVAERVLGTPRPVQPDKPVQPTKRKQGGGRHPKLTQKNIDDGIDIVRDNPTMSWKELRWVLRGAKIKAGDTTLNTHIISPARRLR